MTARQLIDKEINANYNKYLDYCRRVYNGNQLHKDLMQESYIAITEMPENKLMAYINNCKLPALIFKVIFFKHKNRSRKNSNLDDFSFTDLKDLPQEPQAPEDISNALSELKQKHPKHYDFIQECLEKGMDNDGAKHTKLSRTRKILKQIYDEQGVN